MSRDVNKYMCVGILHYTNVSYNQWRYFGSGFQPGYFFLGLGGTKFPFSWFTLHLMVHVATELLVVAV